MRRLGYLPSASTAPTPTTPSQALGHLRDGLAALGYVEGRDLTIEPRWAATSTIPIVFAVVVDPVAAGLVPNRERPGGNLTGLTSFDPDQLQPHLEILKQAVPALRRVAFLGDRDISGESFGAWDRQQAQAAGVHGQPLRIRGTDPDIDGAFDAARAERADAMLVLEMPATIEHRRRIADAAIRYRLPTLFVGGYEDSGALIAYGTSRADQGHRLAGYVDRILEGATPGTLPVERLARYELIVNLATASAIGVTLPPGLIARAECVMGYPLPHDSPTSRREAPRCEG